jgi:hypothetical protein
MRILDCDCRIVAFGTKMLILVIRAGCLRQVSHREHVPQLYDENMTGAILRLYFKNKSFVRFQLHELN